ncbi:MAG: DUF1801 domain-containing protein [Candidatus Kapabacteria bacterium]|jgi:hypothetical protein|nr:DUF1801 domain-containing protein [Candidatus Kapabacteria bacterium]
MATATNKTTETVVLPEMALAALADDAKREDALVLHAMMKRLTGSDGAVWGESIMGYGKRHLRYASGRELDWFIVGFAVRKATFSVYILDGFDGYTELLASLGRYSVGKSCLMIKRLTDVDLEVLEELLRRSVETLKRT